MAETLSNGQSTEPSSAAAKWISISLKGVIALFLLSQLYTFALLEYNLLNYPYMGDSLFSGRILALLICSLLALILYGIVKKESKSILLGSVAALSLLAYGPVSMWLAVVRMDTLYLLLVLAGMYLISRPQAGLIRIFLAALCFAYAFFTKQTALFGFGAACLYLLARREYKKSVSLASIFALISVLVVLIFNRLTDGLYVAQLFGWNMHREFSGARGGFLLGLIQMSPVFCALTCYEILNELKERRLSPWTWFLLGTFSVAFLIFFDGTGTNYFLPLYSGLLICACMGAGRIMSNQGSGVFGGAKIWVYLLIIFQLLTLSASRFYLQGPSAEEKTKLDLLAEQIRSSDEPVLVDRMSSLILGTKHEDYFVEPVLLMYLYLSKQWSPDPIVAAIDEEKFSIICLFDRTQFVPPVVEAVRKHYRPVSAIPVRTIEPNMRRNLIIYIRKRL